MIVRNDDDDDDDDDEGDNVSRSLAPNRTYSRTPRRKQYAVDEYVVSSHPEFPIPTDLRELLHNKRVPDVIMEDLNMESYAAHESMQPTTPRRDTCKGHLVLDLGMDISPLIYLKLDSQLSGNVANAETIIETLQLKFLDLMSILFPYPEDIPIPKLNTSNDSPAVGNSDMWYQSAQEQMILVCHVHSRSTYGVVIYPEE
ncbi:unnamed protein product [Dovyalis caffra]|uniref:Uncharacterized protein n=1 Tax=Dovyalis caffra TaxID=77055 RepID=A0AAV1S120_9ROSI|nr:unnamed protein product [Dovyalis caffra]